MDVKSAFIYGKIEEEVYVCQPPGFEDPDFPDRVYKVEKALYGLHQAPKAWYETLSTYLLENGFHRGQIDKTLFIKRDQSDILIVQVYVDDIIFGSTKKKLCTKFEKMMQKRFQMSSIGELTFFLGLQVKQKEDGIFISQDKYVTKILKKCGFSDVKTASTPMETHKPLLKDVDGEDIDEHMYRSMIGSLMYLTSSRPGVSLDRKSTTGGCQFLGYRLVSWQCKKQTMVANSTTEDEYVAASSCCGHVLWIQNQLLDYEYNFMHTKIYIDNESTICIVKNPVFYSKIKHIEIRHHFIIDSNEKKLIQMIKIHTDKNVVDLLTKAFDEEMGEGSTMPTDLHHTLIIQPSTSQPQKKQSRRKQRKDTEIPQSSSPTDPIAETAQAKEIARLKKRVKKMERKRKSKTPGMKRLFKIGRSAQVVSSKDEGLGDQEDASKQGRKIADLDTDAEEVEVEKVIVQDPVQSTTITAPSAIPRAKGILFHEQEKAPTPIVSSQQPKQVKDKGKGKIVEEEPM
ncbi:putative ribonuclease H-like domain-containing protein [Tanacetum coccineum]